METKYIFWLVMNDWLHKFLNIFIVRIFLDVVCFLHGHSCSIVPCYHIRGHIKFLRNPDWKSRKIWQRQIIWLRLIAYYLHNLNVTCVYNNRRVYSYIQILRISLESIGNIYWTCYWYCSCLFSCCDILHVLGISHATCKSDCIVCYMLICID
jgi:hypothetical protein